MYWALLIVAILLEACGTTCMKMSEGFSKLLPSIFIFVFYIFSFVAFIYALKKIELSFAYAIWAGLGVLIVAVIGIGWFNESINALKIISIGLIIAGVAGINLSGIGH